jgi:hypothetical protein
MEDLLYKIEQIEDAYRRWKHFIYYDNSYLLYRQRLAEFECQELKQEEQLKIPESMVGKSLVELRLYLLWKRLNEQEIEWADLENKIEVFPTPKKINENGNAEDCIQSKNNIIHNAQPDKVQLKSVTWLIDCPVEIHLISVLWSLKNGILLQKKFDKSNYGNLLSDNIGQNQIDGKLSLFVPYHIKYQQWRDGAIKKAKMLVSDGSDILMIGLDIKDYYHSIEMTESDYTNVMDPSTLVDGRLGEILFKVAKSYFTDYFPGSYRRTNYYGLPIGLVSSSILANQYLSKFDQDVREQLQPTYYGRYVDDILIVLNCTKKCKNETDVLNEAKMYLDRILKAEGDVWILKNLENLSIQHEKIVLFYFDAKEPLTLLEKFIREIRDTSSEYRFLPTEEEAKESFEEAAFSIHYGGSKTKLRSIRDFTSNRFGVSSYLAKIIFSAIRVDKVHDKQTARQVCSFFRGGRAIEMFSLWEKAFTYMVVTQNKISFNKLSANIKKAIDQLEKYGKNVFEIGEVKEAMQKHLDAAQQMALALHPQLEVESDRILAFQFRKSNLVRHSYVNYPMVNFLCEKDRNENWSYLNFNWQDTGITDENIISSFRESAWKFSPRFVHFHELALIWIDRKLSLNAQSKLGPLPSEYLDSVCP